MIDAALREARYLPVWSDINGGSTRTLGYGYTDLGNLTENTSSLAGDTDVTTYVYGAGAAGPHAVTSASVDGVAQTLHYDPNGAITRYDIAGTANDRYLAYNADNQPTTIVIGNGLEDATPVAKDEIAYDPNGQRYARRTTWVEGGNTFTEKVAYVGPVEVITDNSSGGTLTITKTRLSPNVMHVKMVGTGTTTFFEYAHFDHLGSIEAVTDDAGDVLDRLAYEPFGPRKKKDWSANISAAELADLLEVSTGHTRKARGFTRHEHLDRTGFIHMNGRVYDPVLGRFLSPDPIVQFPGFSQGWNKYAYVGNTPTSFTDPSGFESITDNFVSLPNYPDDRTGVNPGADFLSAYDGLYDARQYQHELMQNSDGPGTASTSAADGGAYPYRNEVVSEMWPYTPLFKDNFAGRTLESIDYSLGWVTQALWDGPVRGLFSNQIPSRMELFDAKMGVVLAAFPVSRSVAGVRGGATGTVQASEAFHYTFSKYLKSISNNGLRQGTYATRNGTLSPLQAQIELALPANRGLPDALVRIDLAGLRAAGYEVPAVTRVRSWFGLPGGGYEMHFSYPIPPQFITVMP